MSRWTDEEVEIVRERGPRLSARALAELLPNRTPNQVRQKRLALGIVTRPRVKHGLSHLPEYYVWKAMIDRCYNPKNKTYHRYGGRGITVCDRWRHSFENFLADMGRRPSNAYSLNRIDNDGNYEKINCEWATCTAQQNNRQNNHRLTWRDETLTVAQWSRRTGFSPQMIDRRLKTGLSVEEALTRPIQRNAIDVRCPKCGVGPGDQCRSLDPKQSGGLMRRNPHPARQQASRLYARKRSPSAQPPATFKDETGKTYGRLAVIGQAPSRNSLAYWRCRCECGADVVTQGRLLRNGDAVSCGCKRRENVDRSVAKPA